MTGRGMAVWLILAAIAAFAAYVRLAPSDPARWHVAPVAEGPAGSVLAGNGWASLLLAPDSGTPADLLARLDAVVLASPRSTRLAGSVEEGRITWVTRSKLWGFPDYTTAEARPDGLHIHARIRFGGGDLGVNAARLRAWLLRF